MICIVLMIFSCFVTQEMYQSALRRVQGCTIVTQTELIFYCLLKSHLFRFRSEMFFFFQD